MFTLIWSRSIKTIKEDKIDCIFLMKVNCDSIFGSISKRSVWFQTKRHEDNDLIEFVIQTGVSNDMQAWKRRRHCNSDRINLNNSAVLIRLHTMYTLRHCVSEMFFFFCIISFLIVEMNRKNRCIPISKSSNL